MPAPLAEKTNFLNFMEVVLPIGATVMIDGTKTADQRLFACYYDVARYAIKAKKAGLITASTCNTLLANFNANWRDGYLVTASYNPSIPYYYTTGLAEDWFENGDSTSRSRIASLVNNSGYTFVGANQSNFSDIHFARECAFSLSAYINNFRVGNVGTIDSRALTLKNNAITMMQNWRTGVAGLTQFYIRPFMVAIVTDALILYDNVIGLSTAEKNEIRNCWEYVHTLCWRSGDTHPSLKFTSVNLATMNPNVPPTTEQAGLVAQNQDSANQDGTGKDVSLMHISAYTWLYKQGYDGTTWVDRADAAFIHGFPHYIYDTSFAGEGDYYIDYGAFIGTVGPVGMNVKHVNQQMWTFSEFLAYRDGVVTAPIESLPGLGKQVIGGGYYGGAPAVVSSYNPATFHTGGTLVWLNPADPTKVLTAAPAQAVNGDLIATINPSSGTTVLSQATDASKPVLTTAVSNGKQAATFNGSKVLNVSNAAALFNSATLIEFGVVFKLLGTGGNGQFFQSFDSSWSVPRVRPHLVVAQPSFAGSQTTTANTLQTASTVLTTGDIHALLFQWNIAAGTLTIYSDNAVTSINNTAFGTAGSMAAASSNGSAPVTVGSSLNAHLFDEFISIGSLMDSTQRIAWFAAVKAQFGITVY